MKLSTAIEQMQEILKEHGDLDILESEYGYPMYRVSMRKFEDDMPEWNCNAGDKIAVIDLDN